jgi:hypothetical protein
VKGYPSIFAFKSGRKTKASVTKYEGARSFTGLRDYAKTTMLPARGVAFVSRKGKLLKEFFARKPKLPRLLLFPRGESMPMQVKALAAIFKGRCIVGVAKPRDAGLTRRFGLKGTTFPVALVFYGRDDGAADDGVDGVGVDLLRGRSVQVGRFAPLLAMMERFLAHASGDGEAFGDADGDADSSWWYFAAGADSGSDPLDSRDDVAIDEQTWSLRRLIDPDATSALNAPANAAEDIVDQDAHIPHSEL